MHLTAAFSTLLNKHLHPSSLFGLVSTSIRLIPFMLKCQKSPRLLGQPMNRSASNLQSSDYLFLFFLLLTSWDCLQLTQCPKWEVKHDEAECTLESLQWNTDRHSAFLKTPSAPEKQSFNQPLRELTGEAWGLFPFKSHHSVLEPTQHPSGAANAVTRTWCFSSLELQQLFLLHFDAVRVNNSSDWGKNLFSGSSSSSAVLNHQR